MKHLFIINPTAGKGTALTELEEQIAHAFEGTDFTVVRTTHAGHATLLSREAASTGAPVRIYACGGDGTLNEVVNGAAGFDNAAVTHIPTGTGNDFLKIFGPDAARFRNPAAFLTSDQTAFDLIDCNGQLSLDIVCAGLDARVGADVHRYSAIPFLSGIGSYIFSLIVNFLFRSISQPMKIAIGDYKWEGATTLLCVCNGRYYGGGFMPVGEAMPDDGILNVLLIPKVSRLTMLRVIGEYSKGNYAKYPQYIRPFRSNSITLSSSTPITAVLDGEILQANDFVIRLSEKKLNFFYPAGASYLPARQQG